MSRFLSPATLVVIIAIFPAALLPWIFPESLALMRSAQHAGLNLGTGDLSWFVLPLRLLAAGITLIGVGLVVYGLIGIRQMFQACAAGEIFSVGSVSGFRQFAFATLLGAIWSPIEHTALTALLTGTNPHVPGAIQISFGRNDIESIGLALIFFLVAWILAEGRKTQEEMESFL